MLFESRHSIADDGILKFLIDTGASMSLIKTSSIQNYTVDSNHSTILNGIAPHATIQTAGEAEIELKIRNNRIIGKFQILDVHSNIPFDGILGDDFLKTHRAKINYENSLLSLNSIPVPISLGRNTPQCSQTMIRICARFEMVVPINLINPSNLQEGVVSKQSLNLNNSLLIPNAIIKVDNNNRGLITILNTSVQSFEIPIPEMFIEPIPNHSYIYSLAENQDNNKESSRLRVLHQNLRLNHLNTEERDSIKESSEFNDIFHLPSDLLTRTTAASHTIPTTDDIPTQAKTYRYPQIHKSEVEKQIEKMLEHGVIKPSTSPWSSPLWVVPKKLDASRKRKWRLVIDYRKLNQKTIGDSYPLPNIEDTLDQLGHAQYFTTLDLTNGFHQIPMDPKDSPKTAFSTPNGHYEFTRMPFGLKNAPSCFQRMMNNVLTGLNNTQCFVYLDDIVLYGSTLDDHSRKLKNIFSRLREHNLKLQPDKCEFLKKSCEYLGHVISDKGIPPNPNKVASVSKQAFLTLKEKLINEPILQYPDFEKQFFLTTDASDVEIGAVLSQKHK